MFNDECRFQYEPITKEFPIGTKYDDIKDQVRGLRWIDWRGVRFGRLMVVKRVSEKGSNNSKWMCLCDCGNISETFFTGLSTGRVKSCGCFNHDYLIQNTGKNHPNWKGGRRKNKLGYVKLTNVVLPDGRKVKSIFEHIYVISWHLGRCLLHNECVHHLNGIRDDNRIENLELWTTPHLPGIRVNDAVKWAKEILKNYEPDALVEMINVKL